MTSLAVPPSALCQAIVSTLEHAVSQTLQHKRHLGQYAVLWEDGVARIEGADAPGVMTALPAVHTPDILRAPRG